jgi:hypothetical protein
MTSEEYDKLTDEEKRIKIAELCGWDCREAEVGFFYEPNGEIDPLGLDQVPDYLNDLNACHEFEMTLTPDGNLFGYCCKLSDIKVAEDGDRYTVRATAEQRCKAFVLVMTGGEG